MSVSATVAIEHTPLDRLTLKGNDRDVLERLGSLRIDKLDHSVHGADFRRTERFKSFGKDRDVVLVHLMNRLGIDQGRQRMETLRSLSAGRGSRV